MKRATRTNLILIGVVAALGVAVYWQVHREVARFEPPLSALDPATIGQVRVACLQCVARRFERIDGHWMMREPFDLPADDAQVARLLSIATSPVRSRRAFASLNAEKIGLDPALVSLDLDSMHFDIGTTDAFNGDSYVHVGDKIAMVPDRFSPFLIAAPASELDRHLVPRGSVLASLKIDGIEQPQLIETWNVALADRISVRGDTSPSDGNPAVELQLADGERVVFQFIRNGAATVARRDEPALDYLLSPEQATALLGDVDASVQ